METLSGLQSIEDRRDNKAQHYPKQEWIRPYTDGSETNAVKNGGGGVFIEWPNGCTTSQAFPAGATYSNYKAEAEALYVALNLIKSFHNTETTQFVLLSDAQSVLEALSNNLKHQFFQRSAKCWKKWQTSSPELLFDGFLITAR
ncbi:hypothetical protein RRG08_015680 [Elysia crispata]|uniref:RNase H type-1 domain-containing protein n=1 Tax=Elysia crispata TaxID=231223 RepID=A0AAE1CRF2_9GAST|nr:hypothetical protein RRG08_015680 [Elysia crispata]